MLPSQLPLTKLGNPLPTGATLGTGVTGLAVGVGGGLGVTMPERFASGPGAKGLVANQDNEFLELSQGS